VIGSSSHLLASLCLPCDILSAGTVEGFDPRDSTSIDNLPATPTQSSRDFTSAFPPSSSSSSSTSSTSSRRLLEGVTIGIPHEYDIAELSPEVRSTWHRIAHLLADEAGANVVNASLPHTKHALPAYYILAPAEAMSNLSRYDGVRYGYSHSQYQQQNDASSDSDFSSTLPLPPAESLKDYYTSNRSNSFGNEVQRRILVGSFVLSSRAVQSYYVKAQRIRRAITQDFINLFQPNTIHTTTHTQPKIDMLLTPTCVGTALSFKQIEEQKKNNPVAPYLNDIFTIPSNLAGIPALSMPAALSSSSGLPIGLQLLGNYHTEDTMIDVAEWVQHRLAMDDVRFEPFHDYEQMQQIMQQYSSQ